MAETLQTLRAASGEPATPDLESTQSFLLFPAKQIKGRSGNNSIQVGDQLFYTCVETNDGMRVGVGQPVLFGEVTVRSRRNPYDYYEIGFKHKGTYAGTPAIHEICPNGVFISFQKNKAIEEASLKGYYNLVTFINDDNTNEAELFVVNSEASFSSK